MRSFPVRDWLTATMILLGGALIMASFAEARKSHRSKTPARQEVDPAQVKPPVGGEVCFSPIEPCDIKLVKFIRSAEKTLDVAIFDLNLDQVGHEILVQSRKIPVRVLVDRRMAGNEHSLVPMLVRAGARVRYGYQRGIMHNKFVIVDVKMIETGSFNFTNGAAFKNNENQVYLSDPVIVDRFKKRFDTIWAEGKEARY